MHILKLLAVMSVMATVLVSWTWILCLIADKVKK